MCLNESESPSMGFACGFYSLQTTMQSSLMSTWTDALWCTLLLVCRLRGMGAVRGWKQFTSHLSRMYVCTLYSGL